MRSPRRALRLRHHGSHGAAERHGVSGAVAARARRLRQVAWEDPVKAHGDRRPPRRYYRITAQGERALAEALERFHALRPVRPAGTPRGAGQGLMPGGSCWASRLLIALGSAVVPGGIPRRLDARVGGRAVAPPRAARARGDGFRSARAWIWSCGRAGAVLHAALAAQGRMELVRDCSRMSATRSAVCGTARRSRRSPCSCSRSASAPTRRLQRRPRRAARAAAVSRTRPPRADLGDEPAPELDAQHGGAGEPARLEGAQPIVRSDCLLHRLRRQGAGPQRRDADWRRRAGARSRHGRSRPTFLPCSAPTPPYGRTFAPSEEQRGQNGVIVLSDGFWQRRFAGDAVGRRARHRPGRRHGRGRSA